MARRERLVPWLDALRVHARLAPRPPRHTVDRALHTGVVWLDWKLVTAQGNGHAPEMFMVYEALELLALLARIDYDEWFGALSLLWPHAARFWANAFYPDKFELGIDVGIAKGGQLAKWAERAWLANPALSNVGDDYRVLARTQAARAAAAAAPRRWRPLFRLVEIIIGVPHGGLPLKDILCVEEITSCCVDVEVLPLASLNVEEDPFALDNVACLQRMIVAPEKTACVPVKCVVVDSQATRQTLDGIFSSVFCSETIAEVAISNTSVIGDEHVGLERLIYWLALCTFGRYGSVASLNLDTSELQMSDVQVLERTLREGDALVRLFPEAKRIEKGERMVAKASKFVLARPHDATESAELTVVNFEVPTEGLRVITIDDSWVSVLLPGWGQAWIHHSEVSLQQLPEEDDALFPKSQSTRDLLIDGKSEPVVVALLRLVGNDLDSLAVRWENTQQRFSDSAICAVSSACPNLDYLELGGVDLASLDVVARCYEEGTCRADQLNLDVVHDASTPTDLCKFFDCLADKSHRLVHFLRKISLKVSTPRVSYQLLRLLSSAAEMLQRNRYVWYLGISLKFQDEVTRLVSRETIAIFEGLYESLDGQSVAVQGASLPMKAKLAFLSILRDSHETSPSVRPGLDSGVLSIIFQYAAECKKRSVQVFAEIDNNYAALGS